MRRQQLQRRQPACWARQDMAVKIEGDTDLAVAQPLARHLRVNAARKQMGSMGMAQIMEANAR